MNLLPRRFTGGNYFRKSDKYIWFCNCKISHYKWTCASATLSFSRWRHMVLSIGYTLKWYTTNEFLISLAVYNGLDKYAAVYRKPNCPVRTSVEW